MLCPMVRTIRQPPAMVPSPMAAWQLKTTQIGTWKGCPAQMVPKRITEMMPITFCASFVPWL